MMLVIADASPLVGLVRIGQVDVLPAMYGQVVIPPEVASELASPRRPVEVQRFIENRPPWLIILAPSRLEPAADLDPGNWRQSVWLVNCGPIFC